MKKLLFTAISALSICALADNADSGFVSGTTFTGKSAAFVINENDGTPGYDAGNNTQWWAASGDVEGVYTNRNDLANYSGSRPTQWAGEDGSNPVALQITDASVPLYRNIKDTKGEEVDLTDANQYWDLTSDTEGAITFDSLVLFTAADAAPSPDEEDKLVVWLLGEEEGDNPQTNLMITARFSAEVSSTNFVVSGATVNPGEWHRLTIVAEPTKIQEVYNTAKFTVYVDGNQVSGIPEDGGTPFNTFYSRVLSGNGSQVLGGVGFKGTGAVDDLTFTTKNPFVVETFPMTLTVEGEVNYTDKALYVQDAVLTNEFTSGTAVDVLNETKTITIVVGVLDGYEVTGFTKGDAYVNDDEDPCTYYTKDVAVTPEMLNEGYNLTITVVETSGGGDEPTSGEAAPGGSATVKADNETAAEAAVTVIIDETVAAALTAEQKAVFVETFFTKSTVDNGDGTFTVSVAVDEDAVEDVLDVVIAEALETASDGEITTIPAGLCYKIESGSTVSLGTLAKGISTGETIQVKGLSEAAGFYRVTLDVEPIE